MELTRLSCLVAVAIEAICLPSIPHLRYAPDKIWLKYASWLQRYYISKVFTAMDDGACLSFIFPRSRRLGGANNNINNNSRCFISAVLRLFPTASVWAAKWTVSFLVIVKPKHLYTGRFLLLLLCC